LADTDKVSLVARFERPAAVYSARPFKVNYQRKEYQNHFEILRPACSRPASSQTAPGDTSPAVPILQRSQKNRGDSTPAFPANAGIMAPDLREPAIAQFVRQTAIERGKD